MDASAYIGRVGGLAVALGVGAAVMTGGSGVAFADTADGEATSQSDTESTPESPASEDDSTQEQSEDAPDDVDPTDEDSEVVDESAEDDSGVDEEVTDEEVADEAAEEPDATEGLAEEEPAEVEPARRLRSYDQEPAATQDLTPSEPSEPAALDTLSVSTAPVDAAEPARTEEPIAAASSALVDDVAETVRTVVPQTAAAVTAMTAPTAARSAAPVINRLLAAFGLGSLRHLPTLPSPAWAVSALMALASRRELDRTVTTRSVTTAQPAVALAAAAAPYDPAKDYQVTPVSVSGNTVRITNVTGPGGLNNTTTRFGIGGTDLGIMWDNGIRDNPATAVNEHQVLIAFGDTFSNRTPVRTGVWRMNTLFRSTDTTLSNGMYVADGIIHDPGMYSGSPMSDPNFSREIIGNYHYGIGSEVTMIPTAAISVPGAGKNGATRQYINYMAVRSWDSPGRWTTNYSAIAYSDDNGQNWTVVPQSSVRPAAAGRSTLPFVNGDQNFQQGAYAGSTRSTPSPVSRSRMRPGARSPTGTSTPTGPRPDARERPTSPALPKPTSSTRRNTNTGTGRRGRRAIRPRPSRSCRRPPRRASSGWSRPRRIRP